MLFRIMLWSLIFNGYESWRGKINPPTWKTPDVAQWLTTFVWVIGKAFTCSFLCLRRIWICAFTLPKWVPQWQSFHACTPFPYKRFIIYTRWNSSNDKDWQVKVHRMLKPQAKVSVLSAIEAWTQGSHVSISTVCLFKVSLTDVHLFWNE